MELIYDPNAGTLYLRLEKGGDKVLMITAFKTAMINKYL